MKRTALFILLCALAGAAFAEDFPARPVKIVVGFAAGGPTDVIARLVAKDMTVSLGQTFFVENRPGANAIIATDTVAHSARSPSATRRPSSPRSSSRTTSAGRA